MQLNARCVFMISDVAGLQQVVRTTPLGVRHHTVALNLFLCVSVPCIPLGVSPIASGQDSATCGAIHRGQARPIDQESLYTIHTFKQVRQTRLEPTWLRRRRRQRSTCDGDG